MYNVVLRTIKFYCGSYRLQRERERERERDKEKLNIIIQKDVPSKNNIILVHMYKAIIFCVEHFCVAECCMSSLWDFL